MQIIENHVLSSYTTMGIGGNARKYIEAASVEELVEALKIAKEEALPVFVLGEGSNVLIDSKGFMGCVIRPMMRQVDWQPQSDGSTLVTVGAGVRFDDIVAESCRRNLGGIEALSGIPGSAGGSLVQNIGAYGQEISEVFVSAEAVDIHDGESIRLMPANLEFAYRHTALKTADNPFVITSLTLRLVPFDADKAAARCAAHGFKKMALTKPQSASALRSIVLETRRSKAMCYDRDDVNTHSVGSFFVNPVVPGEDAQRINAASIIKNHKPMPSFPAEGGKTKLSAAWLIEQAGFNKGYSLRGAALSDYHCLAIINRLNATSDDVIALAQDIVTRVYLQFRVELQPEVVYLSPNGIAPLPCSAKEAEVYGAPLRPNPLFL
ncbi:MAG: UDP-N-acetylmuramate dehydrogenase [Proteobacteria bacterium]|nr:UDP-N-acetylmuramate dehydrogenase [Pseudomonadota bacterium]